MTAAFILEQQRINDIAVETERYSIMGFRL
jgi:hypothetical protein